MNRFGGMDLKTQTKVLLPAASCPIMFSIGGKFTLKCLFSYASIQIFVFPPGRN